MRPNGRTLHKILQKGRRSVIWGSRALISVRLPSAVLPVPPPSADYCKEWGEQGFRGMWGKDTGAGVKEHREIVQVFSPTPPAAPDPANPADPVAHFVESKAMHDGSVSYSWWEGTYATIQGEELVGETNLPLADVAAHRALVHWTDQYLRGSETPEEPRGPVLDAFLTAGNFAQTHYSAFSETQRAFSANRVFLYFTYSVKWYNRKHARRFCAALKRAFRVAHAHGVDARVLR